MSVRERPASVLEDLALTDIVRERRGQSTHEVTLEELVSRSDSSEQLSLSEEDKSWLNAPAVGNEIIPPYHPEDE